MDLSQLSMADLQALQSGDLSKVSMAGLRALSSGAAPAATDAAPATRMEKFAKGLRDPVDGGAQLLTHLMPQVLVQAGNRANNWLADKTGLVGRLPTGGVDQQVADSEQAYQAKRQAAGESGIDGYRIAGNVFSPVSAGLASQIPRTLGLAGRIGAGAAGGALSGALSPVASGDYADEKVKQIGVGAVAGGVVPAVTSALGRIISPKASTNPDVALLKAEGVRPTIGQTLGGGWNTIEEKAMSIPVIGDAISAARSRAREQFNTAAVNRATAPIGVEVKGAGQNAVAEAGDALSSAYNAGKAQLGHFQIDRTGASELANLRQLANQLPDKERRAFDNAWSYFDQEVSPNGSILADGFKRLDSKLGGDAAKFSKSTDAYQQQVGSAIEELQRIIFENAKRANGGASDALAKADKGWANLVRVEGASKAAQNTGGVFTPAQLNAAIRAADQSTRGRSVARGTALMQDLGQAGQNVLGNKVPNSGTADRLMLGGGSLLGAYALSPAAAGGLIGGAAAYSAPAQAILRGLVSARPESAKAIAETVKRSGPLLAPAGGLLGLQFPP